MTVYAITDTKKGRTGIAPTYLQVWAGAAGAAFSNTDPVTAKGTGPQDRTGPQCWSRRSCLKTGPARPGRGI